MKEELIYIFIQVLFLVLNAFLTLFLVNNFKKVFLPIADHSFANKFSYVRRAKTYLKKLIEDPSWIHKFFFIQFYIVIAISYLQFIFLRAIFS